VLLVDTEAGGDCGAVVEVEIPMSMLQEKSSKGPLSTMASTMLPPVPVKEGGGSYSQEVAPPLPPSYSSSSTSPGPHSLHSKTAASHKPKKTIIEPKVPMRSLFWTRVPDSSIRNTIWEQLSDGNVKLNLVKLESQFCKNLNLVVAEGEEQKEVKVEKKEKVKDISLLDSKGNQIFSTYHQLSLDRVIIIPVCHMSFCLANIYCLYYHV
jgi:hypothetical protein